MESISNCANFVGRILDSSVSTVLSILDLNYILVTNILFIINRLLNHLIGIFDMFLRLVSTAIEDFAAFLIEMYHGLVLIKIGCEESLKQLNLLSDSAGNSVIRIINKFNFALVYGLNSILNTIGTIFELMYAFLCLTARSIVILLQMVPCTIMVLSSTIKNMGILLYQSTTKFLSNIVSFFAGLVIASVENIQTRMKLLPRDAFYGIAIIALCYILYHAHRSGRFRCPPRLIGVGRSLQTKLYHAWEILLTWFWLVRPQNLNRSDIDENEEISVIENENNEAGSSQDFNVLQKELDKQKEKSMCVICQDQPKSIIFLPCRHMCLCEDCCTELLNRRTTCPLCRQVILNSFKVYT